MVVVCMNIAKKNYNTTSRYNLRTHQGFKLKYKIPRPRLIKELIRKNKVGFNLYILLRLFKN